MMSPFLGFGGGAWSGCPPGSANAVGLGVSVWMSWYGTTGFVSYWTGRAVHVAGRVRARAQAAGAAAAAAAVGAT